MRADVLSLTPGTADLERPRRAGAVQVGGQEVRDLWLGRGPVLLLGYSVLLSVVTYLTATNKALNYLEQREAVSFTLQVAVGVGVLLTLVLGADAISGERERGTLDTLLLTPVYRRAIVLGKLGAAASLWVACWVVTVPYLVVLGRGVSVTGAAVLLGLTVGTVLALAMAAIGVVCSGLSGSNRGSLSGGLLLLFALFAPTQLPSGAQKGWFGDLLNHLNPISSGERYLGKVVVDGHRWTTDLDLLVSPVVTALLAIAVLVVACDRLMRLDVGVSGG
jgi:ABC-2 type transport system permease protein